MASPSPLPSTAIIGGGVAGLAAAFRLRQQGLDVTLFEAADRAGGVIRSVRKEGFLVDVGPNTLVPRAETLEQAIGQLNLEGDRVRASPAVSKRFVVRDGRPVPLPSSPPGLLRSPLFSPRAKLRLLREPFIRRGPEDESLAAFVRRRLGREVLDYAVNPFVAGVFAGDPERLSARHAFPMLTALEAEHGSLLRGLIARRRRSSGPPAPPMLPYSFREGMQTLPDTLAESLGDTLRLNAPVQGLRREGGRFILEIGGTSPHEHTADAVVLAVPPHRLPAIHFEAGVDLAPLLAVTYPPVAVLAVGFRQQDVAHPLDGFGMLVPAREPFRLLGCLFSSTLFPGRAPEGHVLLTCFLGGARYPEDALLSEAQQVARVTADLQLLLGVRGEPAFVHRQVWPRAIPQYELGYDAVLDTIASLEAAWPGLHLAGNYLSGISVGEAFASGYAAADRITDG